MAKATNISLAACFQLVVPTPLKLSKRHIVHSIDIIQLYVWLRASYPWLDLLPFSQWGRCQENTVAA